MRIGDVIRDYQFEAKIGEGGMGEVWRARHNLLDRQVAIKVMAAHLMADPEFEARFIKEAQAQARLQHPQVIGASDFFREQGRYYLVMPLIEGQSLEERLTANGGPLPLEEALRISADVLAALDYAHQHAVIHRDVKPSNILLDGAGRAYLTDFGIALMVGVERKTRTGVAIGTAYYMSPEQIRRPRSLDHRTDVYSFGCVLYEMLAGRPPFEASEEETDDVIKIAHIYQTPESVRRWNPAISTAVDVVLMKSLAKDPDQRLVSCGLFARELIAVAQSQPASVGQPTRILPKPENFPSQRPQFAPPMVSPPPAQAARSVKTVAGWLLGLSILYLLPTVGLSLLGLVGAVGMFSGQNWGRRAGLGFSFLLEVAGFAMVFGLVVEMRNYPVSPYDVGPLSFIQAMGLISASVGIVLAICLDRERVRLGLRSDATRPAGILPIAIPLLLTGFGTVPAIGLLCRNQWSRRLAIISLCVLMAVLLIGAIGLGHGMEIRSFDYMSGGGGTYNTRRNEAGAAMAMLAAMVALGWCLAGVLHLKSPGVKSWLS